ncbi:MAG: calcium-binding protein [Sedimenticola sp.]
MTTYESTEELIVNTYTSSNQTDPSIIVLSDGGFVVVWESDGQDGSSWGVYGQRYNADGTTHGDEFQINTHTNSYQGEPSVASLSDGGYVVTWTSAQGTFSIYGQRYNADGSMNGGQFQVNTYDNFMTNQTNSSVTSLSDGGFVVVWESDGQDGSNFGIFGQHYNADGSRNGNEFQVNTYTDGYQMQPSVTSLSDGGYVVTWYSGANVYGQRYNADGSANSGEFLINTYTDGLQGAPSVTSLSDGGFIVTWVSDGQDGSRTGIYGQRYNADGTTSGDEFQINTYTNSIQHGPSVTSLSDDGFVVTWWSDGQDGSANGIFGQRYNADGSTNGDEFQINTYTDYDQLRPSVTSLPDGGFVVTWQSYGQDGGGFGIVAKMFVLDNGEIHGTDEADVLFGTADDDVIYGHDGNDTIWGSEGDDLLDGGEGVDTVHYVADISEFSFSIIDTSTIKMTHDLGIFGTDTIVDIENFQFAGTDYTFAELEVLAKNQIYGTSDDDRIAGTEEDDAIYGYENDDRIRAGDGDDWIEGGADDDKLDGGAGDDELVGGAGNDLLVGGTGSDTFIWQGDDISNGRDKVSDFNISEGDSLLFENVLSGYDPLTDSINDFIQLSDSGNSTKVSIDVDGGGDNYTTAITLTGVKGLGDAQDLLDSGAIEIV